MAIKIQWRDLQARYINWRSVVKIMAGSVEVRPNSWYPTEIIIYKMKAWASGNLYAPTSKSPNVASQIEYNWRISVDGWAEVLYSGTIYNTWWDITIWTWYTPDTVHTVIIRPVTETYWRAKAFNFYGVGIANLLTEVVKDESYMWYADSATNTWNNFREYQYNGCTSLTTAPNETLPNSVTTIWNDFRANQYNWCTSLTTAPNEVMSNFVTTIGNYFRNNQYEWCTSLIIAPNEAFSSLVTTINWAFRANQYNWCTSLTTAANEVLSSSVASIGGYFRFSQYSNCPLLISAKIEATDLPTSVNRQWQFHTYSGRNLILTISWNVVDNAVDFIWPAGLTTTNCAEIRVPSSLLSAYQNASNWSSVASLFVWY